MEVNEFLLDRKKMPTYQSDDVTVVGAGERGIAPMACTKRGEGRQLMAVSPAYQEGEMVVGVGCFPKVVWEVVVCGRRLTSPGERERENSRVNEVKRKQTNTNNEAHSLDLKTDKNRNKNIYRENGNIHK